MATEMESRDYVIAAAMNELGTLRTPAADTSAGDLYLYMKQFEGVFLKVWEAGKREGYAEATLHSACQE